MDANGFLEDGVVAVVGAAFGVGILEIAPPNAVGDTMLPPPDGAGNADPPIPVPLPVAPPRPRFANRLLLETRIIRRDFKISVDARLNPIPGLLSPPPSTSTRC